ncbi:MAG TPA: hypothetical protein DGG95_11010 [Cytophagales bacterium]|jgi:hypothetical protein|nr:hypothetical protein [Cytophagales bacterium]
MTAERKKAVLVLIATFIIGILIGALATGMFARKYYHGRDGFRMGRNEIKDERRGRLANKIYKVVKADSATIRLMKPIVDETVAHLDQVEEQSHKNAHDQLDSLKIKLRPILNEEQMERLEKFLSFKRPNREERRERDRD